MQRARLPATKRNPRSAATIAARLRGQVVEFAVRFRQAGAKRRTGAVRPLGRKLSKRRLPHVQWGSPRPLWTDRTGRAVVWNGGNPSLV